MAINKNIIFKFNNELTDSSYENIMECLASNKLYSGSVSMPGNSSIIFNGIKSQTIVGIINKVIDDNKELEIEIQSYASAAEAIQQLSFTFEGL